MQEVVVGVEWRWQERTPARPTVALALLRALLRASPAPLPIRVTHVPWRAADPPWENTKTQKNAPRAATKYIGQGAGLDEDTFDCCICSGLLLFASDMHILNRVCLLNV